MSEQPQHLSDDHSDTALAVFADTNTLPRLADILQRLGHSSAQLHQGGIAHAIDWVRQHVLPATLIVDIGDARYPLQAFNELAALCGPACKIIVLGKAQDIDLYRNLLQAGALDYLLKPLTLDIVAHALARTTEDSAGSHARAGRTVAIYGVAGGVGTSTVSAGLGLLLATQHHLPCILVDADRSKGDLPLLLGSDADAGLASLLTASALDPRLLQRSVRQLDKPNRLHLLAQKAGHYSEVDPERILELGSMLAQMFSLCLWDLPAAATPGIPEVLEHADVRILLSELSVQHARHAYRLVQQFGNESKGQRLMLVANQVRSTERSTITQAQFEEFVGHEIDVVLPHAGNSLDASLLQGPLVTARHPGFHFGLQQLAALITGQALPSVGSAQAKPHWLSALLGKSARPVPARLR